MQELLAVSYFYIAELLKAKGFKAFLACLTMYLSFLFGSFDIVLQYALLGLALDTVLGFGIAISTSLYAWLTKQEDLEGKFCHKKFKGGIAKLFVWGILLIVGHGVDFLFFHQEVNLGFQNLVITYLGANEFISVLRHCNRIKPGIIPQFIIDKLTGMRDKYSTLKMK